MRPVFIILLAVVFLAPVPMGLSRPGAPSSGDPLSYQPTQLKHQAIPGGQGDAQKTDAQITTLLGNLPLYFVENKGQVNDKVRYHAKIRNGKVYFTGEEIVYQFLLSDEERDMRQKNICPADIRTSTAKASLSKSSTLREETVRVRFEGASKFVQLEGIGEQEAKFNYFRGNDPQKWVSGAPSFQKVVYRELYLGIDLMVSGREGRMKNEYVVKPGGEPTAIRVRYEGAKGLEVNKKGQLEIQTSEGMFIEDVPLSYQMIDGKKKEVRTRYRIATDGTVQFQVAAHRMDTELIIDPLTYSTFLGGSSGEIGQGIRVDGSGNTYITGYTGSSDFPATSGTYDTSHNGNSDVFITKLNSSGSALLYSTFLGGTSNDYGYGIAVDGSGNAYVTGYTSSSNFPTTSGAYDTINNGDLFITKLSSSGSTLFYSTFLGGSAVDEGYGIVIDGSGNAYVTGYTYSSDFPTTSGAYDTGFNGGTYDAFLTKLNSSGSALLYSTFLGGTSLDYGYGIAIDVNKCLRCGRYPLQRLSHPLRRLRWRL